jgi:hypothetical protein
MKRMSLASLAFTMFLTATLLFVNSRSVTAGQIPIGTYQCDPQVQQCSTECDPEVRECPTETSGTGTQSITPDPNGDTSGGFDPATVLLFLLLISLT